MRFFEYEDNDEFREEIDNFFDELGEEELDLFDMAHAGYITEDADHKILGLAIRMLEKSFFWKFRRRETKLKMIEETYLSLLNILNNA